jgi:hypothetical protein
MKKIEGMRPNIYAVLISVKDWMSLLKDNYFNLNLSTISAWNQNDTKRIKKYVFKDILKNH